MDVISAREASEKWGVHIRIVQRYCIEGRVAGARKYGNNWLIPKQAEKPSGSRRLGLGQSQLGDYPVCKVMTSIIQLPRAGQQSSLLRDGDENQQRQFDCELSYMRGDFEGVKGFFTDASKASPSKFYASPVAVAAAISTGDYDFYTKVDIFLKNYILNHQSTEIVKMAELFLATAAVSMFVPEMAPDWLKNGDFSDIPIEHRVFALYLYVKYLQNTRQYIEMLTVAKTTLTLCSQKKGFNLLELYLKILCACASYALEQRDNARIYLTDALALGMPYGFITPFAENVSGLGGLLEPLLVQNYSQYCFAVQEQWKHTFQYWVSFHNHFAKNHVTDILTLQELHIAQLLAGGKTYAETAQHLHMSLGSLNNTVSVIYGKLFIQRKRELRSFLI